MLWEGVGREVSLPLSGVKRSVAHLKYLTAAAQPEKCHHWWARGHQAAWPGRRVLALGARGEGFASPCSLDCSTSSSVSKQEGLEAGGGVSGRVLGKKLRLESTPASWMRVRLTCCVGRIGRSQRANEVLCASFGGLCRDTAGCAVKHEPWQSLRSSWKMGAGPPGPQTSSPTPASGPCEGGLR